MTTKDRNAVLQGKWRGEQRVLDVAKQTLPLLMPACPRSEYKFNSDEEEEPETRYGMALTMDV